MKYRKFGSSNFEVSVLGFGTTRLPLTNTSEAIKILRFAIDKGINYIEVGYSGMGRYEQLIKLVNKALKEGYRERVKVGISLPSPLMNSLEDLNSHLEKYLHLLQSKCADLCILWGLNRETWSRLKKIDLLSWAESIIRDGQVDMLGFSFHDDLLILKEIVNAFTKWSFCQFQYSYMNGDYRPGLSGVKYAASKGLAIIAAEPFLGGRLLKGHGEAIDNIWSMIPQGYSMAKWCLHWVLDHPEVSTVVVNMENIKQVAENITLADRIEPNSLTIQEQIIFNRAREAFRKLKHIPCATCYSCMPCPKGIDAPRILELYNDAVMYGNVEIPRFYYHIEQHDGGKCNQCGQCVEKCPRKINIPKWLMAADEIFH